MNFSSFIAGRITFKSKRTFSKLIVRIAIIGIMLGLGVMILSLAIVKGFKQEIKQKMRGFAGDISVIKYDLNNSYENSPMSADPAFVHRALSLPMITNMMPFANKPGIIRANNEIEGVILKGVDKSYDWSFFKKIMTEGSVIDFSDSTQAKNQIMISSYTANRLRLKAGDKVLMYFVQEPLSKRKFTIKGIFNTSIEEIDKTFVVGDLSVIRRLNAWKPNEIGGYEVRVQDFDQLFAANNTLTNVMPVKLRSYTISESYPNLFEWLNLLDANAWVMLILMLVVSLINMISALLIMILERTQMIGMFKAMGSTNWAIQRIFLYNAIYLIGLGLLFGNFFGLGISFFQYKTHFFKLDQTSYYMDFVPIALDWVDVVLLNIGIFVICLIVLVIPSSLVSKISPVRAIKFK